MMIFDGKKTKLPKNDTVENHDHHRAFEAAKKNMFIEYLVHAVITDITKLFCIFVPTH